MSLAKKFKTPVVEQWQPSAAELEQERRKHIADQEKQITEYARHWNDQNAGTKGLTGEARKRALLAYCKRLNASPKVCESEPRLWAAKIVSRLAEGEVFPHTVVKMAKEVVGVTE